MGLWTRLTDGAGWVCKRLGDGAVWAWNNATLTGIARGSIIFAANTTFQILEQGLALRHAVPSLIYHPGVGKIAKGVVYLVVSDVLPIVGLNYANNRIQQGIRQSYSGDAGFGAVLLTVGTLVDYGVRAYTIRQGAQSTVRTIIFSVAGSAAITADKANESFPLCVTEECNFKRKTKGMVIEQLTLALNDGLAWGVSFIPYAGMPLSRALSVFFYGRYITSVATPDRCRRHKAMSQESILAFALTYEGILWLMDYVLAATVGIPPRLQRRVIAQILLLLQVHIAIHCKLPITKPENATIPFDPLKLYEQGWGLFFDIFFAGLAVKLKQQKGKPLISLSEILPKAIKLVNADLEQEQPVAPGYFRRLSSVFYSWCAPSIVQSKYRFNRDPVVSMYWSPLRDDMASILAIIGSPTARLAVGVLARTSSPIAFAVKLKFGIPKRLTSKIIEASNEQDVWNLIRALKLWCQRNNVNFDVQLIVAARGIPLNGHHELLPPPPPETQPRPAISAAALRPARREGIRAAALMPASSGATGLVLSTSSNSSSSSSSSATFSGALFNRHHRGGIFRVSEPDSNWLTVDV